MSAKLLPRGVYEDPSPPEGHRQFRMIAADGTELVNLRVHVRAEDTDPVPELRSWLDRLMRPSGLLFKSRALGVPVGLVRKDGGMGVLSSVRTVNRLTDRRVRAFIAAARNGTAEKKKLSD